MKHNGHDCIALQPLPCGACESIGLVRKEQYPRGFPLELCPVCNGAGEIGPLSMSPHLYRAIWLVGESYIVRMTAPKDRGVVALDLQWVPHVPPEKGPGKLKPDEMREYERGRDLALQALNQLVGGTFEIVTPRRH